MSTWPGGITAITLFVEDVEEAKRFYTNVFEVPVVFEDENSAVFQFGTTLINLLISSQGPELIGPAAVGGPDVPARAQFTLTVDDVDARAAELVARGATLDQRPDRPLVGHPDGLFRGSGRAPLGDRRAVAGGCRPTSRREPAVDRPGPPDAAPMSALFRPRNAVALLAELAGQRRHILTCSTVWTTTPSTGPRCHRVGRFAACSRISRSTSSGSGSAQCSLRNQR